METQPVVEVVDNDSSSEGHNEDSEAASDMRLVLSCTQLLYIDHVCICDAVYLLKLVAALVCVLDHQAQLWKRSRTLAIFLAYACMFQLPKITLICSFNPIGVSRRRLFDSSMPV